MTPTVNKFNPYKNPDYVPWNSGPKWDKKKQNVLRLYRERPDLTIEAIAKKARVSTSTATRWIRNAGLSRVYSPRVYREAVRLRREEGLHNREISERTGVPTGTLSRWMGATPERLGGPRRYPVGFPERARYLRGCGMTVTEVAAEMNVPRSTAGQWVVGCPCDL